MIHQRQYFCEHKNQYLYIFENIKQYRIYSGDVNFQVPGSRCQDDSRTVPGPNLLYRKGSRIPGLTSDGPISVKLCIYYIKYYFFQFIDFDLQSIVLEKIVVYFWKVVFLANFEKKMFFGRNDQNYENFSTRHTYQEKFVPLIAFSHPFDTHFGSTFFITRWRCLHPRNSYRFSN